METEVHLGQLEARLLGAEREIVDLREDIRGLRSEFAAEFRSVRAEMRSDFRFIACSVLILYFLGLLGVMARGFHWV